MTSRGDLRPGSLSALRLANRQRLLLALPAGQPVSQAELARLTGLAPATISGLVHALVDEGELVVSQGVANGRRSRLVQRAPARQRYGIGIDLGRTHVKVVAGAEPGEVLAESATELAGGLRPDTLIETIASLAAAARERAGLTAGQIAGVAVGVPAPIDAATGSVTETAILPTLVGFPLRDEIAAVLGRPVVVENDANLGALALARRAGAGPGSVVFVKVGSGIGAGVAVGGELLRGDSGAAGEIGHLALDPGLSVVCRCGRRGCLETVGSAESVRSALSSALQRDLGLTEVLALIGDGHPVAVHVLEDAGELLGRGLGWLAMILNPAEIALGGPLIAAGDAWLRPVQQGFRRAVLPGVAERTRVAISPLGEDTEAVGALIAGLDAAQ
ncbi:ROK family transcriptional regulator [Jiangella alkaliphila]|uniref:Sugar kinase of the NBD/HSP70 family, may contain an N-terminal HTH domain n=1 Tax=Jiangella alkaliphila TaxID=419479 RepID=A0A1H2JQT2_9ACTN|nr:ROK family transcriptional regulator [Jiangella alkaliphila]SDU58859.1 Sugar kinase of the NBD/HSP70 family, may contain an N-terminal HTH domain [Jiangella alkaliphila]